MKIHDVGPVTVVELGDQEVQDGPNIQFIRRQLYQLVDEGRRELALDFRRVRYLHASAAVALLINLQKRLREAGGKLALYNLSPEVKDVFRVTHLDTLFDIRTGDVATE